MSFSAKQYRHFLLQSSVAFLFFLFVAAAFNYLIDPYGLFDTNRIQGFNAIKPAAGKHVRQTKPYKVISFFPRTIITGNSRPELGLDPSNKCWPKKLRPVYNLGLPGASLYMQARVLQHAITDNKVGLVLWGMDFIDFLSTNKTRNLPYSYLPKKQSFEERLKVNANGQENPEYRLKKLEDYLHNLFSLDTVMDSLITFFSQDKLNASTVRADGFNPAYDYLDIIASEGQHVLFQQKNNELSMLFSKPDLKLFHGKKHWSPEFETVRRLLIFAQKQRIKVIIFINAYHVDYLISLEQAGLWTEFELWKKQLTMLADKFNVVLWDFSGITPFSIEPAPVLGDKTTLLKWFWEPAHYRKEYGDLMLSRMLQKTCSDAVGNITSVGTLLTPENILENLKYLRIKMNHYRASSH